MEEMREAAARGVKRINMAVVHVAGIDVGRQRHGHRQRAHGGVPPVLTFIVFTTLHLAIVDTLPLCQRCGS